MNEFIQFNRREESTKYKWVNGIALPEGNDHRRDNKCERLNVKRDL